MLPNEKIYKFEYDGKPVQVRSQGQEFNEARRRFNHRDICPYCVERIKKPDAVVLIISNQAGIPNRVAHKSCFRNQGDEAINNLARSYEEAQKHAHWFKD